MVANFNHDVLNNTILLVNFFIEFDGNKGLIYYKTIL